MSWLKIYAKTILFGLLFLVALGLSTWAVGEKATALVFLAFIAALSIWSARFGQLHRIFPGLQLIDALAFLLVIALRSCSRSSRAKAESLGSSLLLSD